MIKKSWMALALAVVAIALSWWWLEKATRPAPAEAPGIALQPVAPAPAPPPPPAFDAASAPAVPGSLADTSAADAPMATLGGEVDPEAPPTLGLPTAGDILAEPGDDYVKIAKKLGALALDVRAPLEDRREALAHALNLSVGNEAEVLTPLVKDPRLPDELAEDILSEALNRPLAYQADLYLEALTARTTPELSTRIREHLAFLTDGPDLGPSAVAWKEAIAKAKATWE